MQWFILQEECATLCHQALCTQIYQPVPELGTDSPSGKMPRGRWVFHASETGLSWSLEVEMQSQTHCPQTRNTLFSELDQNSSLPNQSPFMTTFFRMSLRAWTVLLKHNLCERKKHVEFLTISSTNTINKGVLQTGPSAFCVSPSL